MSKLLLAALFLLSSLNYLGVTCYGANTTNATSCLDDPEEHGDLIEVVIHDKHREKPNTRSLFRSITAYLQSGLLELYFNSNLGTVTVTVSGPSGIESVTCDTASEIFVTIPVSFVPGQYFIEISGPEYEGYGQFEL